MKLIDIETLRASIGDDSSFFNEMLDLYLKTSNESQHLLQESYEKNDSNQFQDVAHKLLAPTKHFSANELVDALKSAENDPGRFLNSAEEFDRLITLIKNVRNAIENEKI